MDLFEAILTRRSIRKYTEDAIADDELRRILECAMNAPSACNEQPWQFMVFRDPANKALLAKTSPYTGMAEKAAAVIVVCGDLSLEKARGYWVQDCSVAIQNLLLAARGLGIGTVWCGVHPNQERVEYLKKTFQLPENVIPLGLICLGRPLQEFRKADRFNEDRIHWEKW